jgi:hypothetical protein
MKSFLLTSAILAFMFISASAQSKATFMAKGTVVDATGQALSYANVLLWQATDSVYVTGTMADSLGGFQIEHHLEGAYYLEVSMIGFEKVYSGVFTFSKDQVLIDAGSMALSDNTSLKQIEVVARKQMYEQAIDRLIINVDKAITFAGGSALDILENSPGITVDRQSETLSLAGKDGVQVMINGRIRYVPAAALLQMLQGMPADNISKIEIITTPPSNLDAEGNAGYINLVLKNSPDEGVNGSLSANFGYGRGPVGGFNINLNARKGRWNVFGDYNLNYTDRPQLFEFRRGNTFQGVDYHLFTRSDRRFITNNHSGRVGFELDLNPRTTVGGTVSGYKNQSTLLAEGYSEIGKTGTQDTILHLRNELKSDWDHLSGNLNLLHKINEKSTLSFETDYLYYREIKPATYEVDYLTSEETFVRTDYFRTSKNTPIRTMVGKTDYSVQLANNMNFEAGVKGVWSSFVNDLDVENKISDTWIPDNSLSGKYDLSEQIAAAYVNINTSLGAQIECKAGLRYEHTWSLLNSEQVKGLIDRQYGSWFPSLFLSRKIDDKNHVNLAYSRRIRRQTFNDLAPFVLFMDPFSFWSGNERLLPSISDNISLSYKHRSILLILQYTYEDNAIMRYQGKIDTETNRMILVSENLDYLRTLNATLTLPWTVNKYWDMQNNIQFNHRNAVFFFEGNGIFIEQNTYSINTTQRFKLPYQLSLELTGSYRSRELRGQFIALPYYGLNAGIQKKLPGEYGTLRFNVADVFDSFVFTTRNTLNDQGLSMDGHWDFLQRTFRLTYSRNLGRKGVKSSRKRAESEERTRVE